MSIPPTPQERATLLLDTFAELYLRIELGGLRDIAESVEVSEHQLAWLDHVEQRTKQ